MRCIVSLNLFSRRKVRHLRTRRSRRPLRRMPHGLVLGRRRDRLQREIRPEAGCRLHCLERSRRRQAQARGRPSRRRQYVLECYFVCRVVLWVGLWVFDVGDVIVTGVVSRLDF